MRSDEKKTKSKIENILKLKKKFADNNTRLIHLGTSETEEKARKIEF